MSGRRYILGRSSAERRRAEWWARVATGALGLALQGCGARVEEISCSMGQALFGASESAEELGLVEVVPALALAELSGTLLDGEGVEILCTATRIAPGRFLSAAHCVPDGDTTSVALIPAGATARSCTGSAAAVVQPTLRVHPELDVLDLGVAPSDDVTLPLASSPPRVGELVIMAGYGLQEDWTIGELEFLEATITELDATTITVSAGSERGACIGDSGGPLFRVSETGYELLGTLSQGSSDCADYDRFVRLAALGDWLVEPL